MCVCIALKRNIVAKQDKKPSYYRQEADAFVDIMQNLAPNLRLDYSVKTVAALEEFIARQFDPPGSKYVGPNLPLGVGCYVGEVIIRNLGGHWHHAGRPEINGIGSIQKIFPIEKAMKRFENGPEDSLAHYISVIAQYAHQ